MTRYDYETELVECGRCDGCGEIESGYEEWEGAPSFVRCYDCAGTGEVEVCANCYDDWNGCSVCNPQPVRAASGGNQP